MPVWFNGGSHYDKPYAASGLVPNRELSRKLYDQARKNLFQVMDQYGGCNGYDRKCPKSIRDALGAQVDNAGALSLRNFRPLSMGGTIIDMELIGYDT